MNYIILMGRLGADPESRVTPNGKKVVNLRLAVSSRRGDKEETVWYRLTIWGDRFDKMITYLKKGSALVVTGELAKPEVYIDREGKSQVSLDVTVESLRFSPFGRTDKSGEEGSAEEAVGSYRQSATSAFGAATSSFGQEELDDGLPF